MSHLLLPPAFDPVIVGSDAFQAALAAVKCDGGGGNFFWADKPSIFDVAVVWEPELALSRAWPARFTTMLAAAEALGALGPPNVPVSFSWPDGIVMNGALVGGIRTASPPGVRPDAVPDWMVVGLGLRLSYPQETAPGLLPEQTALSEEGFGDVTGRDLAEAFARNLLYWIHQWTEVGHEPVARHWLTRLAPEPPGPAECSLDPSSGDLLRSHPDATITRSPLPPAGAPPTWSLDDRPQSGELA